MTEIVAIDGPASVGKSTLAKKVAINLQAPILFSGRLYRAIAFEIINRKISLNNKKQVLKCIEKIEKNLDSRHLYTSEIDKLSSIISTKKYIRSELKKYQKDFPKKMGKGKKFVIIEGRDIGTIIFPKAKYKIFMWAEAEIRAKRRCLQIKKNGGKPSFNRILEEINKRDNKDLNRKIAPLKPSANSVLLDTSYLDIEQALNRVMNIINCQNI
jgi:cytidylate kinase